MMRFALLLASVLPALVAFGNNGLAHFGVAYYPEAWPEERWEKDLGMMRDLGMNLIRVGEFNWSNFEPEEGVFDFKPYLRFLDLCERHGLKVMMCTPTAATPKWMQADYPETEKTRADGTKPGCGIRQSACVTNPKFRFFARRIVERMAEAFKDHPAVTTWQIDNELSIYGATRECQCKSCEAAYREDLKRRYKTLENLNREFNGCFWSGRFTKWEDVRLPIDFRRTGWWRDYVRFLGDSVLSAALEQADILRRTNPKWRLTTNNPSCSDVIRTDLLYRNLGSAATDSYCSSARAKDLRNCCWSWTMFRGLTGVQRPFMVSETGPFCFDADLDRSYDLVKPWFWLMVGHGAESVLYFRWRMSVAGEETHGAILPWNGRKTFVYDMIRRQMEEYRALPESIARLPLDKSDVAIVHDAASCGAVLAEVATFKTPDDMRETEAELMTALNRRGIGTDIVQLADDMDLESYKVVFLPLCFSLSAERQARLRAYVENGGVVVAVNRLNYRSPLGGYYYPETGPVGLTDLFGVEISERRPLSRGHVELADLTTAEPVLRLEHGCFSGKPLLTRRSVGRGAAYYCTRTLDAELAREVAAAVMSREGIPMREELPEGVVRMTRGKYVIVVNYSEAPKTLAAERGDLLMGAPSVRDGRMTVKPFDVVIFRSAAGHSFAVGEECFLLDGKPFVIRCGEMHLARVPRAYWRHRLKMIRACGFNAVCAYLFWNYHEPVEGRFDFTGEKDAAAFCRIAQEEGLWVVLRPGPYTCAEWEFGGLPWWLLKRRGIRLRTNDARYLEPAKRYLAEVGRQLADCQISRGGNILMVQAENEYGFWAADEEAKTYMRAHYEALRSAGFEVPIFCCNGVGCLGNGLVPDILPVVNFGSDPKGAFEKLRELSPKTPLMCGEYYPAWFDSWGEVHHVKSQEACLKDLAYMLERKASFSVYMAHGGTTFGWWAGANAPFRPQVSSYDYDAPVSEAGWKGAKFAAMRALFARHLNPGESLPDPPAPLPLQSGSSRIAPVRASLLEAAAEPVVSEDPPTFEQMDLGYGLAVYESEIPAGAAGDLRADVRDVGAVLVDGARRGFLDRRERGRCVRIEASDRPRRLAILVEPMGRYNFGQIMHDGFRGIVGPVTLGGRPLKGWRIKRLDLAGDGLSVLRFGDKTVAFDGTPQPAGSFYRFSLRLEAKDTYFDMRDWKRGLVCVNGHWIGRYWSIGPTQTMFVPGCWLKDGDNEVIVWDAVGAAPTENVFRWRDRPILDRLRPETDYLERPSRRKVGPLPADGIVSAGEFADSRDVQRVAFGRPASGRYFALESLDAWDTYRHAAGSELDLFDAAGRNIPHTSWTVCACDSEERVCEDGCAENLIDGQTADHWVTEMMNAKPDHPHRVIIDLGKAETVGGFVFTPRQADGCGRIRRYRAYLLNALTE